MCFFQQANKENPSQTGLQTSICPSSLQITHHLIKMPWQLSNGLLTAQIPAASGMQPANQPQELFGGKLQSPTPNSQHREIEIQYEICNVHLPGEASSFSGIVSANQLKELFSRKSENSIPNPQIPNGGERSVRCSLCLVAICSVYSKRRVWHNHAHTKLMGSFRANSQSSNKELGPA